MKFHLAAAQLSLKVRNSEPIIFFFLPVAGLLWHLEGTPGELAVSDLRSGRPTQMSALPQEGRGPQAHPQWNQVGPR